MPAPAFETTPTVLPLYRLLQEVYAGQLLIPKFQRPFVWTDQQRVELLESIVGGIPIGSILVWRTIKRLGDLETYPPPTAVEFHGVERQQYLLDGHQRVITLAAAFSRKPTDEAEGFSWAREIEQYTHIRDICYDLEEQRFEIVRAGREAPSTWLPLRDLFDDYELFDFTGRLVGSHGEGARVLVNRARNLHRTFAEFPIVMIPVATDDVQTAIRSFERANTTGTPMSEVHMVSALTWSREFDLNAKLREVLDGQEFGWQHLDEKVVLTICKAQLDLDLFSRDVDALTDQLERDPGIIDRAGEALSRATEFLALHCGVHGLQTLPYTLQLVLIADALPRWNHRPSWLRDWFWLMTYVEYFGGSNSTQIRKARDLLNEAIRGEPWITDPRDLIPNLTSQTAIARVERFDFRAARSRAIVLRMASLKPMPEPEILVALHGRDAVQKIFTKKELSAHLGLSADGHLFFMFGPDLGESVANRFIADPSLPKSDPGSVHEVRRRIREAREDDLEFLATHAIDAAAAAILRGSASHGSLYRFLSDRRKSILDLEARFVRDDLGLQYSDDD